MSNGKIAAIFKYAHWQKTYRYKLGMQKERSLLQMNWHSDGSVSHVISNDLMHWERVLVLAPWEGWCVTGLTCNESKECKKVFIPLNIFLTSAKMFPLQFSKIRAKTICWKMKVLLKLLTLSSKCQIEYLDVSLSHQLQPNPTYQLIAKPFCSQTFGNWKGQHFVFLSRPTWLDLCMFRFVLHVMLACSVVAPAFDLIAHSSSSVRNVNGGLLMSNPVQHHLYLSTTTLEERQIKRWREIKT